MESTYSEGLNRLFKAFKKTNGTEVIDGTKFRDYCHELYKSERPNIPEKIQSCEPLYSPILMNVSATFWTLIITSYKFFFSPS